jgi:AcrR family transcriptional regulator
MALSGYTGGMSSASSHPSSASSPAVPSPAAQPSPRPPRSAASRSRRGPTLRDEQVAQTRAALVAAGRALFGGQGYAATSVEDLAREARVTTGALYHHFPTKTALFETVFEQVHTELLTGSADAASQAPDEIAALGIGFEAFLDGMLIPDVQRILVTDAPAVLGLVRFTELDERYTVAAIAAELRTAADAGRLRTDDPDTLARLLLGALTRGSMLIAQSSTPREARDAVVGSLRLLLSGLTA